MGPPIFKLFNVGCFAFALACLLFAQETTAKVEYAQHNADFLSSSSIVTLLMKKGSGNDGAASLVPPTATLTAQPSSSSSASSLNEQVQYGVLTKSFVDDQREKNSASCSMEMATCTYQPELSQLMDRAGQVNIITLRSGTAPGELSLAMTVSPDEVFEADHEKLQLTLEGDVIDGASSSSSSTSQALLQLQRRTSHRRTNSTHTKASIKGRSKKSLTFEGVGTYVRAKKLGEGSYGKAYLYKNANNPQDMVVVKVVKTLATSKIDGFTDFIRGIFCACLGAKAKEPNSEEIQMMQLEEFETKDECSKAQELNALNPDWPAGNALFMQCLTFLHESEIAQGNNIPLSRAHYAPTKADRMYMVLDKSGDISLSDYIRSMGIKEVVKAVPAVLFQLLAAVDIMTNNDLNVAYVHSDLKLANIVVKTKSQGEELASRGDHCDITPRISLIDFGGMFRFTSSKIADVEELTRLNIINPAITPTFSHPDMTDFITSQRDVNTPSSKRLFKHPWVADLYSVRRIVDVMIRRALDPALSKGMKDQILADEECASILTALQRHPLSWMGMDVKMRPHHFLRHRMFEPFIAANIEKKATEVRRAGSRGASPPLSSSLTPAFTSAYTPSPQAPSTPVAPASDRPSGKANMDTAYTCMKRDWSMMAPLLQKAMRVGDYTPLPVSEIQNWMVANPLKTARGKTFVWRVPAPTDAENDYSAEHFINLLLAVNSTQSKTKTKTMHRLGKGGGGGDFSGRTFTDIRAFDDDSDDEEVNKNADDEEVNKNADDASISGGSGSGSGSDRTYSNVMAFDDVSKAEEENRNGNKNGEGASISEGSSSDRSYSSVMAFDDDSDDETVRMTDNTRVFDIDERAAIDDDGTASLSSSSSSSKARYGSTSQMSGAEGKGRHFFITGNAEALGVFNPRSRIKMTLQKQTADTSAGMHVYSAFVRGLPVLPIMYRVVEVDPETGEDIFQSDLILG